MKNVSIGVKAFAVSALILLGLMVAAGVLTRVIPSGVYTRVEKGNELVIVPGSYMVTERPEYPAWRWLTAPVEVLGSPDALTAVVIIAFIAVAGGSFAGLSEARVLEAAVAVLARRYRTRRFRLLAAVSLFGMLLGSLMGVFEESVLLVPVATALAASFGWDVLTGLGMSVVAVGLGFAAGISNPFSIGTAQRLAGIPMFSGAPFRILVLVSAFFMYVVFLVRHAKKVENRTDAATPERSGASTPSAGGGAADDMRHGADPGVPPASFQGARVFGWCLVGLLVVVLVFTQVPGLAVFSLPAMAAAFFVTGVLSSRAAGLAFPRWVAAFGAGAAGLLPAGVLILMSLSVKHIIVTGGVLDTVLHYVAESASSASAYGAAGFMYILCLIVNFFIGSTSAKAFLLMPLLTPLADLTGLSRQIAVQAFAFGGGFSNMIYPTNPVLLLSLAIAGVSWPRYARWILPLQVASFVLTMGLLFFAVAIGY